MTDILKTYREARSPLPSRVRSWFLYGVGMENLGRNKKPVEHELPAFGPDELLVRCDATCLCFSDIKVVNQGGDHIRIERDLAADPTVMGHESVVTVVKVGEDLKGRFEVGERYVVQADIFVNGETRSYGYALPGGLREYNVLGQAVLNGDDGCYLIPVAETTGYAEAALSEPWACVVRAYRLHYRQGVKPGGICLIVGGYGREKLHFGKTWAEGLPGRIVAANLPEDMLAKLSALGTEVIELEPGEGGGADALVERFTDGSGFDDIIICGWIDPDCLAALAGKLTRGGVLNVVCDQPIGRKLPVDVGRIHYEEWYYTGNPGPDISASYGSHRASTELRPGGTVWMIGAGGPMGQMHVQRACQMPNGPSLIVATDIDNSRLEELRDRFIPAAEANGCKLIVLNPAESTAEELEKQLGELTAGGRFDDVVAMAPVAALVGQGAAHVADGGLLNIFAGVVRGAKCELSMEDLYLRNIRWVGSSGSRLSDMRETLRMAEARELLTENAVMAIGGLDAAYSGLEMVEAQAVPGKIVIYPQIGDLPITMLSDLGKTLPTVAAKLRDGKYWSTEAEEELLRLKLK